MNLRIRTPILACVMLLTGAAGTEAQLGPVLDWISEMSGPGYTRVGLQQSFGLRGDNAATDISVAAMYGWKVHSPEGTDAVDRDMRLWSVQGTVDAPLIRFSRDVHLLAVVGIAGHVFSGDDFDSFVTGSFPTQVALRIRPGSSSFKLGAGFNVFWFPDDAFDPLDVGVQEEGFEGAFGLWASYQFLFGP
ncbi:MAG: hypothetical protein R3266_07290 [Gemmatimonadota bacterium]|nr:hypothetical protein [Gemmatimonadota bacterium]